MPAPAVVPDLPVFISGVTDTPAHTLLFVHGWPDDEGVFCLQCSHFEATHRIACVRLPWFSSYEQAEADAVERSYSRWGYDMDILAEALARATRALVADDSAARVTVVADDWGSVIALMADIAHPGLFHSMVVVDVALPRWFITGPERSARKIAEMIYLGWVYMWWLAGAFLLAQIAPAIAARLAQRMSRKLSRLALWNRPLYRERVAREGEQSVLHKSPAKLGTHPISGYLYYYLFASYVRALLGLPLSRGRKTVAPGAERLKRWTDCPTCPVLFFNGKDGFPFHEEEWTQALGDRRDGSTVIEFADSGHWTQIEKADETNAAIEAFLSSFVVE